MPAHTAPARIELSIRDIGQLWQSLDPLPFRERELDAEVEAWLVGSVAEMAHRGPIEILVKLPQGEAERDEAAHVAEAFRNHFLYRAEVVSGELRELFRNGRAFLALGLAVLAGCTLAAQLVARLPGVVFGRFFEEGLIILGWVANWHPIQIFLYGWQPLVRRRRILRRLAEASVRLVGS